MAQFCEVEDCRLKGKPVYKLVFQGGLWRGEDCGCAKSYRIKTTINPFAITLDHVHDEFGQKVRVESIAQLSAAEKRFGFESCVLNRDQQNFNDVPEQKRYTVSDVHNWKFGRRR
jgi:hypothetical protein